jgi:hypothetical protein
MESAVKMTRHGFGGETMDTEDFRKSKPESFEPCTSHAFDHALEVKDEWGACLGQTSNVAPRNTQSK